MVSKSSNTPSTVAEGLGVNAPPPKELGQNSSSTERHGTPSESLVSSATDADSAVASDWSSGDESDDTFGVKTPRLRGLSLSRASLRPASAQSFSKGITRLGRQHSWSSSSSSSGRSIDSSCDDSEDDGDEPSARYLESHD